MDDVAAFLLSDQIIWRLDLPASLHTPDLSLGGLLLLQDELKAAAPSFPEAEKRHLEELNRRWEEVRRARHVALGRKADREVGMRLNLWKAYLADLAERPEAAGEFAQQVRQRAMIQRLVDLSDTPPALETVDQTLRASFRPGSFVWDGELAPLYPVVSFWFLYGRPAARP